MRTYIIAGLAAALVGCQQGPTNNLVDMNEAWAMIGHGWRYETKHDRVRDERRRYARLRGDDGVTDLVVREGEDGGPPIVFFAVGAGTPRCASPCSMPYRLDDRRGSWRSFNPVGTELIGLDNFDSAETIVALRSARSLIVELPLLDEDRQVAFNPAGFEWHDAPASDGGNNH